MEQVPSMCGNADLANVLTLLMLDGDDAHEGKLTLHATASQVVKRRRCCRRRSADRAGPQRAWEGRPCTLPRARRQGGGGAVKAGGD
eukprot:354655-Chlamydomonas_euryale.AAC.3